MKGLVYNLKYEPKNPVWREERMLERNIHALKTPLVPREYRPRRSWATLAFAFFAGCVAWHVLNLVAR